MKSKFHAANEKPQHSLMRGPRGFFLERQARDFFVFPLVPDVFPSCSHEFLSAYQMVTQVPKLLPKTFPIAPQMCWIFHLFCVPNVFSLCSCHLSMSSQHVPQVPNVFPNMVPITPDVIPYPLLLSSSRFDLYYRAQKEETTINQLFWDCLKLD